ncbi:putative 1-alkyl-2-acetylglycerophosphocholine esterase [Colletotrichum chlorophyti]|uniref:1-alkyl-2-acetylglycerophosphocholine esterase n=1 Tax=Colletotrichum chlorophyti TaxID=708187 RepID=A0A1Q8RQQ8_9PEZI|nr:putative 1-alkyl-2-acetylglycerophosphocholine esterase [Colletotrichum chlorophyti]
MISAVIVGFFAAVTQALLVSPPTGPYDVSMSTLGLTDKTRLDPYAPVNNTHFRRVMISSFFPVDIANTPCVGRSTVPYMTPLVSKAYDQLGTAIGLPDGTFSSLEMDFCLPKARSCRRNAPKFPLVLFSPGWGNPRLLYGAMAREVASHGFVVVTIDHPYDPSFVEFPDGDIYRAVDIDTDNIPALEALTQVRAQDVSFVLNHLQEHRVPRVDLGRIIMFGHSLGGATAAAVMLNDSRVSGGINLDGMLLSPVLETGLEKPFALVGRPKHRDEDSTWDTFYAGLRGQRALLEVAGTAHASYTDFPILVSSLNLSLPDAAKSLLASELGTMKFGRIGEVVAGIVSAFADLALHGKVDALLTSGNPAFPEVSVVSADL